MSFKPYGYLLGAASAISASLAGMLGIGHDSHAATAPRAQSSDFVCDVTSDTIMLHAPGARWEIPASAGPLPVALDATRITMTGHKAHPLSINSAFQAAHAASTLEGTYVANVAGNKITSCTFTNMDGDITAMKPGTYTP